MTETILRPIYFALSLLILTAAMTAHHSLAQYPLPELNNPTSSIGGDTQCAEYYQLASRTSVMLAQIGDKTIQQTLPFVSTGSLREIVKSLKVVPAHGLDREARSDRATLTTYLDLDKWSRIPTVHQKIVLILHELLVLDGKEGEGEYAVSQILKSILLASRYAFELKCESFFYNVDRTVTVINPFFLGEDGTKYRLITPDGDGTVVCQYLGFSRGFFQLNTDSRNNYAYLTSTGAVKSFIRNANLAGVETAVCNL